jgi:hypothetical protein
MKKLFKKKGSSKELAKELKNFWLTIEEKVVINHS